MLYKTFFEVVLESFAEGFVVTATYLEFMLRGRWLGGRGAKQREYFGVPPQEHKPGCIGGADSPGQSVPYAP